MSNQRASYKISKLQSNSLRYLRNTQTRIFIVIDHREKVSEVGSELQKWGVTVAYRQLEAGDYIVGEDCVVERKTFLDYCRSLSDGRLFDQVSKLNSFYRTKFIVIEGWDLYGHKVHPNAVFGSIVALTEKFRVNLIYTQSRVETANFLFTLAKKKQVAGERSFVKPVKAKNYRKDTRIRVLANFPGIGYVQAKRLLDHFKSLSGVFNASKRDLLRIDGMGNVTVARLKGTLLQTNRSTK